jgi:hypothetical protein
MKMRKTICLTATLAALFFGSGAAEFLSRDMQQERLSDSHFV